MKEIKAEKGKKNSAKTKQGKRKIQKSKQVKKTSKNNASRQSACGVADIVSALKKFTLYTTNLNQNKRIKGIISHAQAKKSKAPGPSVFQQAYEHMNEATGGGHTCNSREPDQEEMTTYDTLSFCSTSAQRQCDIQLSATEDDVVNRCAAGLSNYTQAHL